MNLTTAEALLIWFGARELAQVSVPEELAPVSGELMRRTIGGESRDDFSPTEIAAADAGLLAIERAIADASRLMESHLALRHALPLTADQVAQSPLPRLCGAIARRLLHRERVPEEVQEGHAQALEWLRELAAGRIALPGGRVTGVGAPAFDAPPRRFDDWTLRGFV